MDEPTDHPSRLLKAYAWGTRIALGLVLAVAIVLALGWAVLHGVIVPRIGQWRGALEAAATEAIGLRVTIGEIRAQSVGTIPSFELREVRLFDRDGREALKLERVAAALSVQSLLSLGFEQLLVDAPVLEVRRRADGRIEVAGLEVTGPADDAPSALADWVFSQREFAIRGGLLRWTDAQRPALATLELRAVDLVLRNPGRQHLMRLDATPPAGWGQRLSLRARLSHGLFETDSGDWRRWDGTVYAEAPALDLARLQPYLEAPWMQGLRWGAGQGALRLWADVQHARVRGATADVALREVSVRLAADRPALELDTLQGRFDVAQDATRLDIGTQGLAFRTRQGQVWPGGNLRLSRTTGSDGRAQALALKADRLDLAALRQLASHLPLEAAWQQRLQDWQPSGLVDALEASWSPDGAQWKTKGRASRLAWLAGPAAAPSATEPVPSPGRPGVSGLDMDFEASESSGSAQLQLTGGHLDFPGVFEQPRIALAQLNGRAQWKVADGRIELQIPQLRWRNDDAQGEAKGSWRSGNPAVAAPATGAFWPGVLDLNATLTQARLSQVHRYLPYAVDAGVRRYLREAIAAGSSPQVQFRVKGDLWDFPFPKKGQGEFSVQGRFSGAAFNYAPAYLDPAATSGWPALQRLEGELSIDRTALSLSNLSATASAWPQLRLRQAEARIDDYLHRPVLLAQGRLGGPASDALAFINRSPVADWTDRALQRARIGGNAEGSLRLELPLADERPLSLQGQVALSGSDFQLNPETPRLERVSGSLSFNDRGLQFSNLGARLLGGDARLDGSVRYSGQQPTVQLRAQGTLSAEGLKRTREWPWLAPLARVCTGATGYQVQLNLRGSQTDLLVSSSLQGLAIDLPAPLGKSAASALPLRYQVEALPAARGAARDLMTLEVGAPEAPVVTARFERDTSAGGAASARVLRGAVGVGSGRPGDAVERPTLPDRGVQAVLLLDELDLDAWDAATAVATAAATPGAGGRDALNAYLPSTLALRVRRLSSEGRSFHDLVGGASREQQTWRANIDAREFNGYLEYRPSADAQAGRVYARLARLTLPRSSADDIESLLREPPTQVPALDVVIDSFELFGRPLGRLEVEAINRTTGARDARGAPLSEWRLNRLNLSVPEAQLQASGNWAALPGGGSGTATATGAGGGATAGIPSATAANASTARPGAGRPAGPPRRTALAFRLDINESGALLARFGMPNVVRGGKGRLEGSIAWTGSPLDIHYPSMSGQINLALERGQFLKAEPGLAKLLGVLSLQSLPRRLVLDFRDVFSEGFAFDFMRGDARIDQGVLSTNNLQMKGVNAAVLMEGSADLLRETQDLSVVVVPELNAGTASLLATAINPAVGLGTFLAQYLLRQPLQEAATQHFRITGGWADPKVEKVARRAPVDASRELRSGSPP